MREITIEGYADLCDYNVNCGYLEYTVCAMRGQFLHRSTDIENATDRVARHDARANHAARVGYTGPLTVIVASPTPCYCDSAYHPQGH